MLQGLKDPEAKRKAIGAGFIEVFNDFAKGFDKKPRFLVQACSVPPMYPAQQPSDTFARNLHTLLSCRAGRMQDTSQHRSILHQREERGPVPGTCLGPLKHHIRGRGSDQACMLQGTLYPDVIESMPPPGKDQKHSHMIKSHHNVGGLPKDLQFTLIEPLRELFKACTPLLRIYILPVLAISTPQSCCAWPAMRLS